LQYYDIYHIYLIAIYRYSQVFNVGDFHGLRMKVCSTFYIISSATQGQPWPSSL